jgi:hypothetical protein
VLGVTTHGRNVLDGTLFAVVNGSGIAGLPAAHVLVEYFLGVTVVERDVLPATAIQHPTGILTGEGTRDARRERSEQGLSSLTSPCTHSSVAGLGAWKGLSN